MKFLRLDAETIKKIKINGVVAVYNHLLDIIESGENIYFGIAVTKIKRANFLEKSVRNLQPKSVRDYKPRLRPEQKERNFDVLIELIEDYITKKKQIEGVASKICKELEKFVKSNKEKYGSERVEMLLSRGSRGIGSLISKNMEEMEQLFDITFIKRRNYKFYTIQKLKKFDKK